MVNKNRNKSIKKTLKIKSPKKISKFQKMLKFKFKNNTSATIIPEKKGKIRLQKIKLALQKSKIKNKKAVLNLNKIVYKNKEITDIVNSSFSELIKSPEKFTTSKFFEVYKDLFYDIPKKGEKSHESLIKQSREYIDNYADPRDTVIESLIESLEKKDEELNLKLNPNPTENLFYPDGTFLRTHGWNVEYVSGVPQGLPIWVMQQGMKREFKDYDTYNIVKNALGFEKKGFKELGDGKVEIIGDRDVDITELLHVNELNWIPTGADINNDGDLNIPPGPDRKIDLSLGDIIDYRYAEITCLEGSNIDPNSIQPEDYSIAHDLKDSCYIQKWKLNGTRGSNRWDPGDSIKVRYMKDNPSGIKRHTNVGYMNDVSIDWEASNEDGIFGTSGYMKLDFMHPENIPTKYINLPTVEGNLLPNYVPPKLSNYGTRMYQRYGYGDQRNSGTYKTVISDKLWEQVFDDPSNVIYNNSVLWDEAEKTDNVVGSKKGGYKGGFGGYLRNIYLWWDGNEEKTYYVANVGTRNGNIYRAIRHYMVVLNKDYKGHGPLSQGRVKMMKSKTANQYHSQAKLNLALDWRGTRNFPTTEGGYFIPQEYWDEYGLE